LTIIGTLEALKRGTQAEFWRRGRGIMPLMPSTVDHGGDRNTLDRDEQFVISWVITTVPDGVVVTSEYSIDITGITVQWRNNEESNFLMNVTAANGTNPSNPIYGSANFTGGVGTNNVFETVVPNGGSIDIPNGVNAIELHVPNTTNDHFGFRGITLDVNSIFHNTDGKKEMTKWEVNYIKQR
jgi:hypothetical protein